MKPYFLFANFSQYMLSIKKKIPYNPFGLYGISVIYLLQVI